MRLTKTFFILFAISVLSILCTACSSKKSANEPIAGSGSGNLTGNVFSYNDKTNATNDLAGFTVSIDDISNTSVKTDENGKYNFMNLIYGIHDLTFSKPGYGTFKLFGVNHSKTGSSANTIIHGINLGLQSTNQVTNLKVNKEQSGPLQALRFTPTLNPVPSADFRGYYRLFFSTDPNVSNTNYKAYTKVAGLLNANAGPVFTSDDFSSMGFNSGQTIYAKAYGDSFFSNDYEDPNTGIHIFPNLNATSSNIVQIIVP